MTEGIVEFGILGPFEVVENGDPLDLGPHKQRSLLALLLINANRTVTTDRILEELWGDEASGKENALWVYISRVRSVLGEESGHPSALLTRDGGYSLAVERSSVDFHRFETAAMSGRAALKDDPEDAAATLRAALALWRGDALEDFRYDEFAQAEINRLEELRVTAIEDRIEADLRLGGSGELVGELDALIDGHPLRERPISLKMLALYRAGRQADALRTFERFRRTLGEEMGLEPSPELARLEEQILLHDARLQTTMRSRIRPAPTEYAQNPFKGLQPFQEADADHFFGRDRLVGEVIRRIADQRLVTLVGPSGSGKSSVVRAGVIPALRKEALPGSGRWLIAQMVPGSRPFAELEAALLRSTIDAPDSLTDQLSGDEAGILRAALRVLPDDTTKILIVIDQFEELFTLVDDEETRTRFLDGLTDAINDPHERVRVLLTLRADFYDRPLHYPTFGARMGDGVVNVVPMAPDELEQAAGEPAARAGVSVSPSLLASLLTDVVGQPGALPLFQYTLSELFDRRAGGTLDLETYEAMGGLRGTLTRRADDLFSELSEQQRAAARQLLLRLVTIADTDEWSRRRVAASEIVALDVDIVDLKAVIDAYGGARLLTFDRDHVSGSPTVEVAHEALLTEWERLREWIEDAREDVKRHAALTAAMMEWGAAGSNPDYVLAGSRLEGYEQWAVVTTMELTAGEKGYLEASIELREHAGRLEAERVAAEQKTARAARRRLWSLVAVAAAVLATIATWAIIAAISEDLTIALVNITPRDGGNEYEDLIYLGFDQATRTHGFEPVALPLPYTDSEETIDRLVEGGVDLIISPEGLTQLPSEAIARHPEIPFILMEGSPTDLINAHVYRIGSNEGGFLAGAAAALTSERETVGFVGAVQTAETIDTFRAGFNAGARYINPNIEVISIHASANNGPDAFVNPDAGYQAANMLFDRGADVVFQVASQTGDSVFDAARERSVSTGRQHWAIGVDTDQYLYAGLENRPYILTSITKQVDQVIAIAIQDYLAGNLETGVRTISVADGAVDYGTGADGLARITDRLDDLKKDLAGGTIVVPFVPTDRPLPPPGFTSAGTASVVFDVAGECTFEYAGDPIEPGSRFQVEISNNSDRVVFFGGFYPEWGSPQGNTYIASQSSNVFYSAMDEDAAVLAIACNPDPGGPDDAFTVVHEFVATG